MALSSALPRPLLSILLTLLVGWTWADNLFAYAITLPEPDNFAGSEDDEFLPVGGSWQETTLSERRSRRTLRLPSTPLVSRQTLPHIAYLIACAGNIHSCPPSLIVDPPLRI
jgi:hypothetical protein